VNEPVVTAQLYTQCRGCGEIFSLSTEALTCAYGRVRCSVCGTVFNALDTLTDQPGEGDLPLHDTDNAPPLLQHPDDAEEPEGGDVAAASHVTDSVELPAHGEITPDDARTAEETAPQAMSPAEEDRLNREASSGSSARPDPNDEFFAESQAGSEAFPGHMPAHDRSVYAPADTAGGHGVRLPLSSPWQPVTEAEAPSTADLFEPLSHVDNPEDNPDDLPPDFAEHHSAPSHRWHRVWRLGTAAGLLALIWQAGMGIQKGAITLPDAPWANALCQKLGCPNQAAAPLALDRIASISSSIRPHPGREDALIISTTFMNTAKQPMPFPALEVTLSDLDGKTVAMRRFLPGEYLPENLRHGPMLPQTLIPVSLEIIKPEGQANAFQIDFSQPGGANRT